LNLPGWYLGAGCVAQTVWNLAHGKPPGEDILDYDLVYYDGESAPDRDRSIAVEARELVRDLRIELDVTNQARIHDWYPRAFGYRIQPYVSKTPFAISEFTNVVRRGTRVISGEALLCANLGLGLRPMLLARPSAIGSRYDVCVLARPIAPVVTAF
jgi:hypothetical protein